MLLVFIFLYFSKTVHIHPYNLIKYLDNKTIKYCQSFAYQLFNNGILESQIETFYKNILLLQRRGIQLKVSSCLNRYCQVFSTFPLLSELCEAWSLSIVFHALNRGQQDGPIPSTGLLFPFLLIQFMDYLRGTF
jgi:hypothetical protein